jgi:hypothetical protein
MKTALCCVICLCAALLLTACGAARQPLVRTELIEVPVNRYVALPAALTDPLPPPPEPAMQCRQRDGTPAVCALDGLLWSAKWEALLSRANADRAAASRLGREAAAGLSQRDVEVKP